MIIEAGNRMVPMPLAAIESCTVIEVGSQTAPVEIPDWLLQAAQGVAGAAAAPIANEEEQTPPTPVEQSFDSGTVECLSFINFAGVHVVHVDVADRRGRALFTTTATRWNLHGIERFENGTSLYLHHLDHPTQEQRVILWPGKNGTFDSFSEAVSFGDLHKELRRRDVRLAKKPQAAAEPPKSWYRAIALEFPPPYLDQKAESEGGDPELDDADRYEPEIIVSEMAASQSVRGIRIKDTRREEIVFDLSGTGWDLDPASTTQGTRWLIGLRRWPDSEHTLWLRLNLYRRTVNIANDTDELPLAFVERHLHNFALYEPWRLMFAALLAGPHAADQPDLVLPLAGGFSAELWAGEVRFPVPFLQPRFVDARGGTVLDFRTTTWAAGVTGGQSKPVIELRLTSEERDGRFNASGHLLRVDLVTRRVTCATLEGSTTIGMLQAMLRHVRGSKWMSEELPELFAKGRDVPLPTGSE